MVNLSKFNKFEGALEEEGGAESLSFSVFFLNQMVMEDAIPFPPPLNIVWICFRVEALFDLPVAHV